MSNIKNIKHKLQVFILYLFLLLSFVGFSGSSIAYAEGVDSQFQAGDWLLRMRATLLVPEDGADNVDVAGIASFQNEVVDVKNSFLPELDITYFLNENLAVEVICCAAYLRAHASGDLAAAIPGLGLSGTEVAETWALPATIMFQYHFNLTSTIKPYVGVGPTYVLFLGEKVGSALKPIATDLKLEDSWGFTLQAGVDANIGGNWFLNLDAKYMHVEVDAKWNTPGVGNGSIEATNLRLNPWVLSVGLGYRF